MGNTHSSGNHPNRLTKPKTNTNSPSLPVAVESPSSVTSRYADLSAKGRLQIREALLSPINTEFDPAVFQDKDVDNVGEIVPCTRGRSSRVPSRSNSRTHSRSNSLSCFGSRHGSTTKLNELHGSKLSLASNTQIDMDQAIRMLQDMKRNGSPEDIAALQNALEESDGVAMSNTEHSLSRRTSAANGSSSSLTRRRSLVQTPGVATRSSPIEGRRRTWNSWKPQVLTPEEEAKWTPSPKNAAANRRLKTVDAEDEDGVTLAPRAQTPGEAEYTHLGGLKLGTLSIVNGAPSPAPSAKKSKHRSQVHVPDDYFNMTEDESSPLTMKSGRKRGHVKSKSAALPSTGPYFPEPLRVQNDTVTTATNIRETAEPIIIPQDDIQLSAVYATHRPVTSHAAMKESGDASRFAEEYQAAIPSSPFKKSLELQRTWGDEVHPPVELDSTEINQCYAGTAFDAPTTALETPGSTLFAAPSTQIIKSKAKANQRPPPQTADSGYSSGGSVRVANNKRSEAPTAINGDPVGEPIRPNEMGDSRPRRPNTLGPVVQKVVTSSNDDETREQLCLSPIELPVRSGRSSESESLRSPQTPRSIASRASFDSTNSTTQRRLYKKRPSQAELPVVQSCRSIPEGNIPEVPENVRVKFTRRMSHTPEMECLTHTYPSKDHVISGDSMDDRTSMETLPHVAPLMELEPERGPTPPPQGRRSLSLFRRRSAAQAKDSDQDNENGASGVVDLGTIASSLGNSPYDAAMSSRKPKSVTSPTHPHQLGSSLPRAKSMVGMGSEAAAEYARMHSRDRALMEREMPQHGRRRSHHNLKADVGEIKASKRRPQSSYYDIPPVPMVDTSKLVVPHSAKPRLETYEQSTTIRSQAATRSELSGHTKSHSVNRYDYVDSVAAQENLNWDVHAQNWSRRRKSVGEGLRAHAGFSDASASTTNIRNSLQPADNTSAWGRYSGGLDYNYERGAGVGGSAGTRQLHSYASQKSMHWRNQYGVDLSDVPVMLQRAA